MDSRLLKSQRTDVFEIIKVSGMDPLMFSWDKESSKTSSTLRFPDEYFYFEFGYDPRLIEYKYYGKRAPGSQHREVSYQTGDWQSVLIHVANWIKDVKNELSTPDPWEALPGFADLSQLHVSPKVANTQFSFAEAQQVAKGLGEVRNLLLEYAKTSKDRSLLIDEQINSLIASSTTMGRKDWLNLAIGGLINLAVMIALPSDVTRQIFDILKRSLNGIVHLLPPLGAVGSQLLN